MMFTVQYRSSLVIYHKRGKQWVSQQCGWQCVTNTQRHLLGVCSTKIDCASRRSLSLSVSLLCSFSHLLSSPFLYSAQRRTCDAKIRTRCWKALKRKNDRFVLSLGAVQICSFIWKVCFSSWSLLMKPIKLYKCTYNVSSRQPLGVRHGKSTCDFQKALFNIQKIYHVALQKGQVQMVRSQETKLHSKRFLQKSRSTIRVSHYVRRTR